MNEDNFLGYLLFETEFHWSCNKYLDLNLYRVGGEEGSPVLNGGKWSKISYSLRENNEPNCFRFKSLAGHFYGETSIKCIDPFVLDLIKEYADKCFINPKDDEFFQYHVKKSRYNLMMGTLFAPNWEHEPSKILQDFEDDIPF